MRNRIEVIIAIIALLLIGGLGGGLCYYRINYMLSETHSLWIDYIDNSDLSEFHYDSTADLFRVSFVVDLPEFSEYSNREKYRFLLNMEDYFSEENEFYIDYKVYSNHVAYWIEGYTLCTSKGEQIDFK